MKNNKDFDIIIIGGSYAGLASAMALGRALKKVLVIDSGYPCNRQTPYSHNFLTNDGKTPGEIAALAKFQVDRYSTVSFVSGIAIAAQKIENSFEVTLHTEKVFMGRKLIFATGIRDLLPTIQGLADCWGISVIHCPYCHGYEVKDENTGILGNGNLAFDFTRLIANWTADLTLFTNGVSTLDNDQTKRLNQHKIYIDEREIHGLEHENGQLQYLLFKDGSRRLLKALYAPSTFEQHCRIPEQMGCELTEEGYIKIDMLMETTVKGAYAIGDNAGKMRTVANAVAMGTTAGMIISKEMILQDF